MKSQFVECDAKIYQVSDSLFSVTVWYANIECSHVNTHQASSSICMATIFISSY